MQKYHDVVLSRTLQPIAGAKVLVKTLAGADATLYANNSLAPLANPVTADSLGNYSFYAADGHYNLLISVNGTLLVTIDDVLLEDPADTPSVSLAALAASGGAGLVGNTPAGNIAAATVQGALNELDTEKASLAQLAASGGSALVGFLQAGTGAVAATVQAALRRTISPMDFGAVGDGVTDDGAALNLAIGYLRTLINAAFQASTVVKLDLAGKNYVTTISLNATALREGWEICNGTITGKCTGKAVLDTIGSRSGRLTSLTIRGDKTNRPSVGIQAARSSVSPEIYGFCDGMLWDHVHTAGYFSTAAVHLYGQEGTTYNKCIYFNNDSNAYVAIYTGYSSVAMSSDYLAPITGSTSYINNKYINCDHLPLPDSTSATVAGITKANPAVVTAAGHPFTNGQTVVIGLVNGMGEINNVSAVVASATTNTFALTGVNSTAFGTYTSGGQAVVAQTKPTVLFARGEQHHFDTCYVVNYGSDSFSIDFPDAQVLKSVWLDILFEGIGSRSHVRFTAAGSIYDFKLQTYDTHARDYIMSMDSAVVGAGTVSLFNPEIVVVSNSVSTPVLLSDLTKFALYGADVFVPNSSALSTTSLSDRFTGRLGDPTNNYSIVNARYSDYRDGAYTPTLSASTGTITTSSATGYAKRMGDLCYIEAQATITTAGTGANALNISLPFAAVTTQAGINGYDGTGASVRAIVSGSNAIVRKYDNNTVIANGAVINVSGWYRVA